ncbi:hypothetical protein PR048_020943 [Dryococelus australis]|uniref:Uncharacterized protein n=1 Tax=Dryococelus australis TaxID=614101 RepID=A0ABQ9GWU3_9NEOP|nr:hypothetical protein PR048_020943 [Dryococelus australis]
MMGGEQSFFATVESRGGMSLQGGHRHCKAHVKGSSTIRLCGQYNVPSSIAPNHLQQTGKYGAVPNEEAGETGDLRENPPTSGIVRHDSHLRKSGVNRPGVEHSSPWWEASSLTAQPPPPLLPRGPPFPTPLADSLTVPSPSGRGMIDN